MSEKGVRLLHCIAVLVLGRDMLFTVLMRLWLGGAMFETTNDPKTGQIFIRVTP